MFLAAVKQLYKPVCPSVGRSHYIMLNNFTYLCLFYFNEVSLDTYGLSASFAAIKILILTTPSQQVIKNTPKND